MNPTAHTHAVALRAPQLLQHAGEDFIDTTLEALKATKSGQPLGRFQANTRTAEQVLKLFQPMQRQFHLLLLQAFCEQPGEPRLDPAKVLNAGCVLRRIGPNGQRQAWVRAQGRVQGWVNASRLGGPQADPDPANRAAAQRTGVADLDRALAAERAQDPDAALQEHTTPLFVAPPEVGQASGATWLFGMVCPTSAEQAEALAPLSAQDDFGPDSPAFRNHLVEALRGEAMDLPFAGQALNPGWADALEAVSETAPEGVSASHFEALSQPTHPDTRKLQRFMLLLRQLGSEFDVFEGSGPSADALRQQLRALRLPLALKSGQSTPDTVSAFDFLQQASRSLLEKTRRDTPEMPTQFPALAPVSAVALRQALHGAVMARAAAQKVGVGRFDEPQARYVLRAFVRLKPEGGCPQRVVWSAETEPFVIAPWYEGAGGAPVQIPLPDPSDRNLLRSLKPNVAFVVPPALQNLLNGPAKSLLGGQGKTGGLGLTWVCSFSIPIITLCAFLVLNVFLTLFNIVFGWMFFLKICLPLPKFGDKPPPGGPP